MASIEPISPLVGKADSWKEERIRANNPVQHAASGKLPSGEAKVGSEGIATHEAEYRNGKKGIQ